MHPYETELLAKAHIDDLRREAEQDRRAHALSRWERRGRHHGAARRYQAARWTRTSTPAPTAR